MFHPVNKKEQKTTLMKNLYQILVNEHDQQIDFINRIRNYLPEKIKCALAFQYLPESIHMIRRFEVITERCREDIMKKIYTAKNWQI